MCERQTSCPKSTQNCILFLPLCGIIGTKHVFASECKQPVKEKSSVSFLGKDVHYSQKQ